MAENNGINEKLVKKYQPYLTREDKGKGGIFTTVMRGNLLGVPVKGRKIRDKDYDFRYDVRNQLKNALVDLELFLETANEKDVNEVFTAQALEPIVRTLLLIPTFGMEKKPDRKRADIAKLFIHAGLRYLEFMQGERAGELYKRGIEDAYRLSIYLTELFEPSDKQYNTPVELLGRFKFRLGY